MKPGIRLILLVALWMAIGLAAAFWQPLEWFWKGFGAFLIGAAIVDLVGVFLSATPDIARAVNHNLPVGVWKRVNLNIRNPGSAAVRLELHDLHPAEFAARDLPRLITVPGRQSGRLRYQIKAPSRGRFEFTGVAFFRRSPLGLWWRKQRADLQEGVKVYPNFSEISHYTLLATDHRLSQMGVVKRQRRGEGSDFHQLREYREGDSLRQIDWKATARFRKVISKEYQDERDQQIVFLLDCGRRMRHREGEKALLDEALNAMLLLAYVASLQGDAVGLLAFGGSHRWLPPRKGRWVVNDILDKTFDLESAMQVSDYIQVARVLESVQRRRALVVLITNTRDEDHESLSRAVQWLRRRHLVVVADLRESALDEAANTDIEGFRDALRFQASHAYLDNRTKSHEVLEHRGAIVLDLLARQLPIALVNQYFSIKGRGVL